jgi:hypothetical protein
MVLIVGATWSLLPVCSILPECCIVTYLFLSPWLIRRLCGCLWTQRYDFTMGAVVWWFSWHARRHNVLYWTHVTECSHHCKQQHSQDWYSLFFSFFFFSVIAFFFFFFFFLFSFFLCFFVSFFFFFLSFFFLFFLSFLFFNSFLFFFLFFYFPFFFSFFLFFCLFVLFTLMARTRYLCWHAADDPIEDFAASYTTDLCAPGMIIAQSIVC